MFIIAIVGVDDECSLQVDSTNTVMCDGCVDKCCMTCCSFSKYCVRWILRSVQTILMTSYSCRLLIDYTMSSHMWLCSRTIFFSFWLWTFFLEKNSVADGCTYLCVVAASAERAPKGLEFWHWTARCLVRSNWPSDERQQRKNDDGGKWR